MNESHPGRVVTFRALLAADFPQVRDWLSRPHVAEWWGRDSGGIAGVGSAAPTLAAVEARYGPLLAATSKTHNYIVLLDGAAIGLVQTYRLDDYPDYAACIGIDEGAGIDLFIGELDHVGRGIGSLVIAAFARDVVFGLQGMEVCVASPDPRNLRSLRAFEKAGFERRQTFTVPGTRNRETLLVLRRR
jgi:RimJ/RimL family protein N-acetyltransferase